MMFRSIKQFLNKLGNINLINAKTEKILVSILLCSLSFLVFSQIGLSNKATRTFFTDIDQYEGINVNNLESVFQQGYIALKLMDITPSDKIKILVNGYEAYDFNAETVKLKVRNNSLIEIDGTAEKDSFTVKIIDISDNISTDCLNKVISVRSNIEVLTRIFLK